MAIRKGGMQNPFLQILLGSAANASENLEQERKQQEAYKQKTAIMDRQQAYKQQDRSQEQTMQTERDDRNFTRQKELADTNFTRQQELSDANFTRQQELADTNYERQQTKQETIQQFEVRKAIGTGLAQRAGDPKAQADYLKAMRDMFGNYLDYDFDGKITNLEAAATTGKKLSAEDQKLQENSATLMGYINQTATIDGRKAEFADAAAFIGKNKVTPEARAAYDEYAKVVLGDRAEGYKAEVEQAQESGLPLPAIPPNPFHTREKDRSGLGPVQAGGSDQDKFIAAMTGQGAATAGGNEAGVGALASNRGISSGGVGGSMAQGTAPDLVSVMEKWKMDPNDPAEVERAKKHVDAIKRGEAAPDSLPPKSALPQPAGVPGASAAGATSAAGQVTLAGRGGGGAPPDTAAGSQQAIPLPTVPTGTQKPKPAPTAPQVSQQASPEVAGAATRPDTLSQPAGVDSTQALEPIESPPEYPNNTKNLPIAAPEPEALEKKVKELLEANGDIKKVGTHTGNLNGRQVSYTVKKDGSVVPGAGTTMETLLQFLQQEQQFNSDFGEMEMPPEFSGTGARKAQRQ